MTRERELEVTVMDEARAIDWLGGYKHPGVPALARQFAEVRASAYAQGRADEREKCVAECLVKVKRDAGYGGQWEGYGSHMGYRTGPECAAAIRARDAQEGASDGPA
jgi:hypothetical protein